VAATVEEAQRVCADFVTGTDPLQVGPYREVVPYVPRDESPGYHHVVTRGNNQRTIYEIDQDREFFCRHVTRIAQKYGWTIIAYCLMDNHYHLIILVGDKGLSRGMCELNTGYAVRFNAVHGRINHLFGKRYWSRRLRSEGELFNAVRYVVRNRAAAGGSQKLEGYRWSSYAATIGLAFADMQLARDELLAYFGRTPEEAIECFVEFCAIPVPRGHERWQPP
jgi:REP element-mobilizing transposase RayT